MVSYRNHFFTKLKTQNSRLIVIPTKRINTHATLRPFPFGIVPATVSSQIIWRCSAPDQGPNNGTLLRTAAGHCYIMLRCHSYTPQKHSLHDQKIHCNDQLVSFRWQFLLPGSICVLLERTRFRSPLLITCLPPDHRHWSEAASKKATTHSANILRCVTNTRIRAAIPRMTWGTHKDDIC